MISAIPEPFGTLLRRYRVAARLTQEELAQLAWLSPRAISDLERGERSRPRRDTVKLLADALHLGEMERAEMESAVRRHRSRLAVKTSETLTLVELAPRHNLPVQFTSFVGRVNELADVQARLESTRLLTLTGSGGCGKTRLALAAAADLEDRFRLLVGGSRTAPRRHQTIRGLIDWSHDLLSNEERVLFRRLGVFAGGWVLAEAEAVVRDDRAQSLVVGQGSSASPVVTSGDKGWIVRDAVLNLLRSLVDKSLVIAEAAGHEMRFRFLETIREYALERLERSDELEVVREAHAAYFLGLAEKAYARVIGAERTDWLDRVEVQHDNFRAALTWSSEHDSRKGLLLAGYLSRFWRYRGYFVEGRRWLEHFLPHDHASGDAKLASARGLVGAGILAYEQGDYEPSRGYLERGLILYRELQDTRGTAEALRNLGWNFLLSGGQPSLIRGVLDESLDLARSSLDRRGAGLSLVLLSALAVAERDNPRARQLAEEALALLRPVKDSWSLHAVLSVLQCIALAEGDWAQVQQYAEEDLEVSRRNMDRHAVAYTILTLARLARPERDLARMRRLLIECLPIMWETGGSSIRAALSLAGVVATHQGMHATGVRLLAAGSISRPPDGSYTDLIHSATQATCDACLVVARTAMGEEAFAAAWSEGRGMALDRAVAYALSGMRNPVGPDAEIG